VTTKIRIKTIMPILSTQRGCAIGSSFMTFSLPEFR
jgi:hypothetical protein